MAGIDMTSIVATFEASTSLSLATPTSVEAGQKINAYSQAATTANLNSPAVVMNPIFLMTPDGVVHVKIDQEHHVPEITLSSFNMARNTTLHA